MGRSNTHVVVTGDGNNISSTNTSADTVTINGRTYELPENGPLVVDGNRISTGTNRRR